jgi:hypothetical protein
MSDQYQDSPKQPEQKAPDSGQSVKLTPSPEDLKRARRRKLLKGLAAGVPAIITLQSGAVLANQSIGDSACIADGGKNGNFTAMVGDFTKRCTTVNNIGNDMNWASYQDAAVWGAASAGPALGVDKWCLPYMTANGVLATKSQPAAGQWGANATGTGVNAWPSTNGTGKTMYAVKQSCWTSFY